MPLQQFSTSLPSTGTSTQKLHQTDERPLDKGKKRKYIFQAFREVDRADMMHLKDDKRFKMVKCLIKYFTEEVFLVGLSVVTRLRFGEVNSLD